MGRITEILNGKAYKPRLLTPRCGRFYARITVAQQDYSLGGYDRPDKAIAAYEAARKRVRLGEPILPSTKTKPTADDVRRWSQPANQETRYGDQEGEAIIAIEPDQEQSVFLLHDALKNFHPKVRKFCFGGERYRRRNRGSTSRGI
jgi:hypothetical protein